MHLARGEVGVAEYILGVPMIDDNCNAKLCPFEKRIERIEHLLDGNGKEGLVAKQIRMEHKIDTLLADKVWIRGLAGGIIVLVLMWLFTTFMGAIQT